MLFGSPLPSDRTMTQAPAMDDERSNMSALTLVRDGAQLLRGAARAALVKIESATASLPSDRAVKSGLPHVAPPFELLAEMVTLRVHLDPVTEANAPLLIAPGSHRFGRVPESDIARVVRQCGVLACLADAGDVWIYATPILRASETAAHPTHRRVLQADFAVGDLPGGLQWLGI